ncbi:MAG: hypothetical protein H6826_13625 [Planctomycetes bacterium]|nr:hypothetical protein [Planctomycetota bacterium]
MTSVIESETRAPGLPRPEASDPADLAVRAILARHPEIVAPGMVEVAVHVIATAYHQGGADALREFLDGMQS